MNLWTTLALACAAALGAVGALYRLTPTEAWPPGLRWVGATSWYLVAGIVGAVGYGALFDGGRDEQMPDDSPDPPDPEPVDAADEAKQATESMAQQEQRPTPEQVAEDINELTQEVE